jgi:hypothetical protein
MSPKTVALPQSGAAPHPCGCRDGEPHVCRLECLERPLFSSGQLLTDQDLTALVEWTRKKSGLVRLRHGWGVVCGLDLYCDPKHEGQLLLAPGYAVDCCGNDIVVCAETNVGLDACCKPRAWPCEDPMSATDKSAPDPKDEEREFGGLRATNARAVDLILHYDEQGGSPRAALGRAGSPATVCEYTRTKESYRVECLPAVAEADAAALEADRWLEGYGKCLDVVSRFTDLGPKANAAEIQDWLKRWIEKNPPHQFGFLTNWISEQPAKDWNQKLAMQVLFWIVQDCRNAYLQSGCSTCGEAAGVPIGRAWVRMVDGVGGKSTCRVLAVDTQPPFRRPIRGASWPAPLGHVNAGPAVWRRLNDAAATLRWLGMNVKGADTFDPTTIEGPQALTDALSRSLMVPWDSTIKLLLFTGGNFGPRCIGISPGSGK